MDLGFVFVVYVSTC